MQNDTEMPERIWAFEDDLGQGAVPRGGMWCDEQSECPKGSPEYVRAVLCASRQQVRALTKCADVVAEIFPDLAEVAEARKELFALTPTT